MAGGKMYRAQKGRKQGKTGKGKVSKQIDNKLSRRLPHGFVDEYAVNTEISTSTAFINLTDAISQSTTFSGRQGSKAQITNLDLNMYMSPEGTSTSYQIVRVILFQWRQDNTSADPTMAGVFYDPTNNAFLSPILPYNKGAKIIMDRIVSIGHYNDGRPTILRRKFSKKHFLPLDYQGNTDKGRNQLYMAVIGNVATGTNCSTLNYHVGITFVV